VVRNGARGQKSDQLFHREVTREQWFQASLSAYGQELSGGRMKHILLLATSLLLSGCLGLNDVKTLELNFQGTPPADRAYVIVQLSVEESTQLEMFIAEYSLERQDITGTCWRYNLMFPIVPAIGGTRQYFAFDVKPGHYVPLAYHDAMSKGIAFEVPAGRIVYLGEFILTSGGKLELKRDLESVKEYFRGREILLAETRQIPAAKGIVCGP